MSKKEAAPAKVAVKEYPRKSLLETFKGVAPALAAKDMVPALSCLCFDGSTVYCFDDSVALVARFATDFRGGIPGTLVMDWLGATTHKTVSLAKEKDGRLLIRSGRARLSLGLLPTTDFILEVPALKGALEFPMQPKVIHALKCAALCLGTDPGSPWRLGVTVAFNEKSVVFYASDNVSICRALAPAKVPKELVGKAFILPPRFVGHLLERVDGKTVLLFSKKWLAAKLTPDLTLYSRALAEVDVPTYVQMFQDVHDAKEKALEIPKAFGPILTRSSALLRGVSEASAELRIKDNALSVLTSRKIVAGRDRVELKGKHPDVHAKLMPDLVLRGLQHVQSFFIAGSQRLVMFGPGFTYIVSVAESE